MCAWSLHWLCCTEHFSCVPGRSIDFAVLKVSHVYLVALLTLIYWTFLMCTWSFCWLCCTEGSPCVLSHSQQSCSGHEHERWSPEIWKKKDFCEPDVKARTRVQGLVNTRKGLNHFSMEPIEDMHGAAISRKSLKALTWVGWGPVPHWGITGSSRKSWLSTICKVCTPKGKAASDVCRVGFYAAVSTEIGLNNHGEKAYIWCCLQY